MGKAVVKIARSVWLRVSSFSKLGGRAGGRGGRSLLVFL